MHRSATKKQYLKEDVEGLEPILSQIYIPFTQYLPKGSAVTDTKLVDTFVNSVKKVIISNKPTIEKFLNSTSRPIPKFIKIEVGTDSTGSEKNNVDVANARLKEAKRIIKKAFTDSKVGYYDTQIESWITSSQNYQPSKLNKNVYDKNKVGDNPKERYIKIKFYGLSTMGKNVDQITSIEKNADNAYVDLLGLNIDEDEIARQICKLETYSDITDLNKRFQADSYGSLQGFLNSKMYDVLLSNSEQRNRIKGCLNSASSRSGKGNVAQIVGDQFTIDLSK
jgi:hypothetical protein